MLTETVRVYVPIGTKREHNLSFRRQERWLALFAGQRSTTMGSVRHKEPETKQFQADSILLKIFTDMILTILERLADIRSKMTKR